VPVLIFKASDRKQENGVRTDL